MIELIITGIFFLLTVTNLYTLLRLKRNITALDEAEYELSFYKKCNVENKILINELESKLKTSSLVEMNSDLRAKVSKLEVEKSKKEIPPPPPTPLKCRYVPPITSEVENNVSTSNMIIGGALAGMAGMAIYSVLDTPNEPTYSGGGGEFDGGGASDSYDTSSSSSSYESSYSSSSDSSSSYDSSSSCDSSSSSSSSDW